MLNGKQKRYLRSLAHHIDPIFQVGKGGVNPNMIKQIADALEARELIKITVLRNATLEKEDIATDLASKTGAEIVQMIGNIILLYKESKEHKEIILPM